MKNRAYYNDHLEEQQARGREYARLNAERQRDRAKRWRLDNPERAKLQSRKTRWKEQGINMTLSEYNQLFQDQLGCCAVCGTHQTEMNKALAVDHDHNTGEIRGLLCDKCNQGIGFLGDNVVGLENALKYLKGKDNE